MAATKISTNTNRKETRQERKARMKAEKEAMETCHKLIPYCGAFLLFGIVAFIIYVQSLPVKTKVEIPSNVKFPPEYDKKSREKILGQLKEQLGDDFPNRKITVVDEEHFDESRFDENEFQPLKMKDNDEDTLEL